MPVPGLHVVTDDAVLADPRFPHRARALLDAHGAALALHLRGPGTPVRTLLALALELAPAARKAGALLLVNDRLDVALAADAGGVHLGERSLPVAAARRVRQDWVLGASVHDPGEVATAAAADFLVAGTIWATPSHPERAGAGPERIRRVVEALEAGDAGEAADAAGRRRRAVIAIGGVTPERVGEALAAGAAGVAVIRGVWAEADPVAAAGRYRSALGSREAGPVPTVDRTREES